MAYDTKQGNYIRAINVAGTILANDPETIASDPKTIAKAVGALALELYKVQNKVYESEGFEAQDYSARDSAPKSRSGSPKRPARSSGSSTRRSSTSGDELACSPKQRRFFESLIDQIEDAGGDPLYTLDELNTSASYDERQERVNELIEQRDDLK